MKGKHYQTRSYVIGEEVASANRVPMASERKKWLSPINLSDSFSKTSIVPHEYRLDPTSPNAIVYQTKRQISIVQSNEEKSVGPPVRVDSSIAWIE
jgi:hypothetical protein